MGPTGGKIPPPRGCRAAIASKPSGISSAIRLGFWRRAAAPNSMCLPLARVNCRDSAPAGTPAA
jgi:hypothetical protein